MNKMFEQFQLNKEQMNLIEGGSSVYCDNLHATYDGGIEESEKDLFALAWATGECSKYYKDIVF